MDDIINLLVENYIYVALGSVFLIVVLIGILVSSKKNKRKSKNPDMVSMSDVTTGSINDVAKNLGMQNNNQTQSGMQPLSVAEITPSINSNVVEEIPQELYSPIGDTYVASHQQPIEEIPQELLTPMGDITPVNTLNDAQFNPFTVPTNEPIVQTQDIEPERETTPIVEPATEFVFPVAQPAPIVEPINVVPTVGEVKKVYEPEVMDIIDVPTPVLPNFTVDNSSNAVNGSSNGDTPIFEKNNY